MSDFEQILQKVSLPQALQAELRQHWDNYRTKAEQQQITPLTDPVIMEQLLKVWSASEFCARYCSREPQVLHNLLTSGDLQRDYQADAYHSVLGRQLNDINSEADLYDLLRRFRNREMVRIAWRDLAGLASLNDILKDLSNLADALIDGALQWLYLQLCERFGTPRDKHGNAQQLVVLGMGKLGGQELNFSSDIDLIFIFPQKGETDGKRSTSNEEFFRRLGQRLIKSLSEITPQGCVYRVDMRLRPFGEAGPLVMPFSAFEDYYQNHGREWERYAMIKARVVAGDKTAGEQILSDLRPFIYRRYLDYSAFESLRTMKALIAREVERKGLQRNVKLGPGGIREIEFIGQAFQLIYGGREPALRQRSILAVLGYLAETERLSGNTVDGLKKAYDFLRRTENRLQAWADQQTHDLPTDDLAKLRLAISMGYEQWQPFVADLSQHVKCVREQFALVFAVSSESGNAEHAGSDEYVNFETIWNAAESDEAVLNYLQSRGFNDPQRASQSLRRLHDSFSYRALSEQGRTRLKQLLPLLLKAVSQASDAETTLERIVDLLQAIARRTVYLSLLIESPIALSQLVKLCDASPWIAHYLGRYPLLLDDLLNTATLYKPLEREKLEEELTRDLQRIPDDDAEQQLDVLRHFKQTNVLRVAAADVSGAMRLMVVSDYLTEIAEVLLRRILQLAWNDLIKRFGKPRCIIDGETHEPTLAIIGYGKLGGLELSYSSDLDLVFLHDSSGEQQYTDGPKTIDNVQFFSKLVQRMIQMLDIRTAAGVLYEVDTRLRPSGRSGLLVSSFAAFAEYQHHQAWTWEHQALVRTRFIAGSESLRQQFNELRQEILCLPRDHEKLRQEVRDMRERMRKELGSHQADAFDLKQDRGGIADIEFIVQYLVLAHAHEHPDLARYSDNIRQLAGFELSDILSSGDVAQLRDSYRALRRYTHLSTLQEQSKPTSDTNLEKHRHAITQLWERLMEAD